MLKTELLGVLPFVLQATIALFFLLRGLVSDNVQKPKRFIVLGSILLLLLFAFNWTFWFGLFKQYLFSQSLALTLTLGLMFGLFQSIILKKRLPRQVLSNQVLHLLFVIFCIEGMVLKALFIEIYSFYSTPFLVFFAAILSVLIRLVLLSKRTAIFYFVFSAVWMYVTILLLDITSVVFAQLVSWAIFTYSSKRLN